MILAIFSDEHGSAFVQHAGQKRSRRPPTACAAARCIKPPAWTSWGVHGAFEVVEADEDAPNLMGKIPLEYLDFVVDPNGRRLIPNPEHGDKQMSEEY